MPSTPSKPAIAITTVEDQSHPLWLVLMEQSKNLNKKIPFFEQPQLHALDIRTLLVAQLDQCIVGITSFHKNSFHIDNAVGVGYVSTHVDYRNIGVATAMVKALFLQAQLQGKAIANTPYEPEGEIYLRHVMERTWNRFPDVELIERDYNFS